MTQLIQPIRLAVSPVARDAWRRVRPTFVQQLLVVVCLSVIALAIARRAAAGPARAVRSAVGRTDLYERTSRARAVVASLVDAHVLPVIATTTLWWRREVPAFVRVALGDRGWRPASGWARRFRRYLTLAMVGAGLGLSAVALGADPAHAATTTPPPGSANAREDRVTTAPAKTTVVAKTTTKTAAVKTTTTKTVAAKTTTTKTAAVKTTTKVGAAAGGAVGAAVKPKATVAKTTTVKTTTPAKTTTAKTATAKTTAAKVTPAKTTTAKTTAVVKTTSAAKVATKPANVTPPTSANAREDRVVAPTATKATTTKPVVGVVAGASVGASVKPTSSTPAKGGTSVVDKAKKWLTKPYSPPLTDKAKQVGTKVVDWVTLKDVQPVSKAVFPKPSVPAPKTQPGLVFTPKASTYSPCKQVNCAPLGNGGPTVTIQPGPVSVSGVPNGRVTVPYQQKVPLPVSPKTYTVNGKTVTVQPKPVTVTVGGTRVTVPAPNAVADPRTTAVWEDKVPAPPKPSNPLSVSDVLLNPVKQVNPPSEPKSSSDFTTYVYRTPAQQVQNQNARKAAATVVAKSALDKQVDAYAAQNGWTPAQTKRVKALVTQQAYATTLAQVTTQQAAAERATKPSPALTKALAASDAASAKKAKTLGLTPAQAASQTSRGRVAVVTAQANTGVNASTESQRQRAAAAEQKTRASIVALVPTADVRKAAQVLGAKQGLTPGMTKTLADQMVRESVTVTANGDPRNPDSVGVVTARKRADAQTQLAIGAVQWDKVTKTATDQAAQRKLSPAATKVAVQKAKDQAFAGAFQQAVQVQAERDRQAWATRQGRLDATIPNAGASASMSKKTPQQQLDAYKAWREANAGPQGCSGALVSYRVGGMGFLCRNYANNDQLNFTTLQIGVAGGQLTEIYPYQRRAAAPAVGYGAFAGSGNQLIGGDVSGEIRKDGTKSVSSNVEIGVLPWASTALRVGKVIDPKNGNATVVRVEGSVNKTGGGVVWVTNDSTGKVVRMSYLNVGRDIGTFTQTSNGKTTIRPLPFPTSTKEITGPWKDVTTVMTGGKATDANGAPKKISVVFGAVYKTSNVWDARPVCGTAQQACSEKWTADLQRQYDQKLAVTKVAAAKYDAATQDVVDARLTIAFQQANPGKAVPAPAKLRADYQARSQGVDTSTAAYQNGGWKTVATKIGYGAEASALTSTGYPAATRPGGGVTVTRITVPSAVTTMPDYPSYTNPSITTVSSGVHSN